MLTTIRRDRRESTDAYARAIILVDGREVGLIAIPASQYDHFIETIWDGNSRLKDDEIHFEKHSFSS
jgi:hypothetical protein